MQRAFLHTMFVITCSIATSQSLPSQLSLGGFQLGQLISTAEKKFGKPFQVRTTPDDWQISAFWTSNKHEHLLAFECEGPEKQKISSIQLSGKPTPSNFELGGVTLGAKESEAIKVLGRPGPRPNFLDHQEGVINGKEGSKPLRSSRRKVATHFMLLLQSSAGRVGNA